MTNQNTKDGIQHEAPSHRRPSGPAQRRHPAFVEHEKRRAASAQLRIADSITAFAGSMRFVYIHASVFALWMIFVESDPRPKLTLIVSLEAIFLSSFVMIGQNRQAELQRAEADHDFATGAQELQAIHTLTTEIHQHVVTKAGSPSEGSTTT